MNFDFLNPLMNGVVQQAAPIPQIQPMSWMTPGFNPNAPIVGTQPQLPSAGVAQKAPMSWLDRMNANPNAWSALGDALMTPNQVTVGPMGSLITQDPGLGARIGAGFASAEKAIQTNEDRAMKRQEQEQQQAMRAEQIKGAQIENATRGESNQVELRGAKLENKKRERDVQLADKTMEMRIQKMANELESSGLDVKMDKMKLKTLEREMAAVDALAEKYPELKEKAALAKMMMPVYEADTEKAKAGSYKANASADYARMNLTNEQKKEQKLQNEGLEAIPANERGRIKQSSSMSATEQAIANRMEVWGSTRPEPTDAKGKAQWLRERANAAATIRQEEYARVTKTGGATGGGLNSTAIKAAETILFSPQDYSPEAVANAKATMEQAVNIPRVALPTVKSPGTETVPKASAVKKFTRDPKTGKIVLAK